MSDFEITDTAHHVIMVENGGVQINAVIFFEGEDYSSLWSTIHQNGSEGDVYTLYWTDDVDVSVEDSFRFGDR